MSDRRHTRCLVVSDMKLEPHTTHIHDEGDLNAPFNAEQHTGGLFWESFRWKVLQQQGRTNHNRGRPTGTRSHPPGALNKRRRNPGRFIKNAVGFHSGVFGAVSPGIPGYHRSRLTPIPSLATALLLSSSPTYPTLARLVTVDSV